MRNTGLGRGTWLQALVASNPDVHRQVIKSLLGRATFDRDPVVEDGLWTMSTRTHGQRLMQDDVASFRVTSDREIAHSQVEGKVVRLFAYKVAGDDYARLDLDLFVTAQRSSVYGAGIQGYGRRRRVERSLTASVSILDQR